MYFFIIIFIHHNNNNHIAIHKITISYLISISLPFALIPNSFPKHLSQPIYHPYYSFSKISSKTPHQPSSENPLSKTFTIHIPLSYSTFQDQLINK